MKVKLYRNIKYRGKLYKKDEAIEITPEELELFTMLGIIKEIKTFEKQDYTKLTYKELLKEARKKELNIPNKIKKEELIKLLEETNGN